MAMGARHESQLEEATRTVSADQAALSAAREALAESEAETAKLREQLSSRAAARESQAQAVQAGPEPAAQREQGAQTSPRVTALNLRSGWLQIFLFKC